MIWSDFTCYTVYWELFYANIKKKYYHNTRAESLKFILPIISKSSMAGETESNMYTHRQDSGDIGVFERQSSKWMSDENATLEDYTYPHPKDHWYSWPNQGASRRTLFSWAGRKSPLRKKRRCRCEQSFQAAIWFVGLVMIHSYGHILVDVIPFFFHNVGIYECMTEFLY